MTMFRKIAVLIILLCWIKAEAIETHQIVSFKRSAQAFPLSLGGKPATLLSSENDWPGVIRAFKDFRKDLKMVTGAEASWVSTPSKSSPLLVIAGTIGRSKYIDQLIRLKKINVSDISGKWEASLTQVVDRPFPGVDKALVIAGSDKRGTIYGIYTLSAQIGVSPWYYWADVPVAQKKDISVLPGRYIQEEPAVKYRGIFLNDEAPALTGWARTTFGGLNYKFYEKVFELILRLKGNYLWPAMWGSAFNDDDPESPKLADEMGVVMGTSHHEPLTRAHDEWRRFGKGAWNYNTNAAALQDFWRGGIKRMGKRESIVSIGMRGDGDEPMSEESNIALLEKIVMDQREIIKEETGKPADQTPQLWALYKEVQDYYDKGMRVPDDVTLLLCDDNWGNIRKLPAPGEKVRKGGYGIYYHYDYVGGPRNYKWLNTNPISKVWEQMNLAHKYGANQIWIVNVGDLKPMEFPIEFFLDFARRPEEWPAESLQDYTSRWAAQQFGEKFSDEIAEIISEYTRFNGRRKPELLSPTTYSLVNYLEFERVVNEYKALEARAVKIENQLPQQYRDAYFQLVLHPVQACSNLYELYFTVGKNRMYATQGRAATNDLAVKAQELFERDKALSHKYNKEISGGKWNHMMDQTHISYVSWNDPKVDVLPEVKKIVLPAEPTMGIAVEGSMVEVKSGSKDSGTKLVLDQNHMSRYFEIFNKSGANFDFEVKADKPWLKTSMSRGTVSQEQRIWIEPDWNKVPSGFHNAEISITGAGSSAKLQVMINKAAVLAEESNYLPSKSYLALEASDFTKAVPENNWKILPGYGRTFAGLTSIPVNMPSAKLTDKSPYLEYEIIIQDTGLVKVNLHLSPTLDFLNKGGLHYAVSFDDERPVLFNLHENENMRIWERSVANNIREQTFSHHFKTTGKHVLKFWRVDPGVVLQRIIFDSGGLQPSYLGPPAVHKKQELKALAR